MKQVKSYVKRLLFLNILLMAAFATQAQQDKQEKIRELIDSKQYVFTAQSMSPATGGFRNLTSTYDLQVSKDTVDAFLPYFGRVYVPIIDPTNGPLRFTSTDFSYTVTKGRKNSWDILIKPKDVRSGDQLYLTVFSNGSASLRVISTDRQPITFNGYISKAG